MADPKQTAIQRIIDEMNKIHGSGIPGDPMDNAKSGYDIASKITDNPYLGTAIATGLDVLPMVLGGVQGRTEAAPELEMGLAARMGRAKEMGFGPKTYYHGTPENVEGFRDTGPSGRGTFFTDDPSFAEHFAGGQSSTPATSKANIIPVKLKAQKTFDPEDPEHIQQVVDILQKNYNELQSDPNTHPDILNSKGWTLQRMKALKERNPMSLARPDNWAQIERGDVQNAIKDLGYDSYHVNEGGRQNIAVYNPNQIRSVNAKFDPRLANSNDLLAAQAPASIQQQSEDEPKYADGGEVQPNTDQFLNTISQIESSGGKNLHHPEIQQGIQAGDSAVGQYGLMPNTIRETAKRFPDEQTQNLLQMDNPAIADLIKQHPEIEKIIATKLANRVLTRFPADQEMAAYAWNQGTNLTPEQAQARHYQDSPYVQKFRNLQNMLKLAGK